MRQLTLKNYFFVSGLYQDTLSLAEWLVKQMLHGKESRCRTRFIRLTSDKINEVQDERLKLVEAHSKRDADGKQLFRDKDGNEIVDKDKATSFVLSDEDAFNKEYADYLNEDYVIDILPAQSEIINVVRDILLNTQESFTGRQATLYEEWCESFEKIK